MKACGTGNGSNENIYFTSALDDHETFDGTINPGEWWNIVDDNNALRPIATLGRRIGTRNATREAFTNRDIMKEYLNTVGSVDWQLEYIRRT